MPGSWVGNSLLLIRGYSWWVTLQWVFIINTYANRPHFPLQLHTKTLYFLVFIAVQISSALNSRLSYSHTTFLPDSGPPGRLQFWRLLFWCGPGRDVERPGRIFKLSCPAVFAFSVNWSVLLRSSFFFIQVWPPPPLFFPQCRGLKRHTVCSPNF